MTPKEKAKKLIEEFYKCMPIKDTKLTSCHEDKELVIEMELFAAKQCALIAVNEILKIECLKTAICGYLTLTTSDIEYWEEVEREIKK